MTTNHCGTCTMCCRLMGITELQKPPGQWCSNCHVGVGCKIYETRPKSCAEFECIWLQSQQHKKPMHAQLRPDKSKVVLDMGLDGKTLVAHVDPSFPMRWREGKMGKFLQRIIDQKLPVVIATGDNRKAFLPGGWTEFEDKVHEMEVKSGQADQ